MPGSLDGGLIILGSLIKVLLFPAYHSTDFDVHRNWLALTHNLSLDQWYFEATSEWTLDYPPFFAYFEYILSHFVPQKVLEDGCLQIVSQDGQYGWPTVVFQRLSVLTTELVLAYALSKLPNRKIATLLWLCPSWLILDHIHFQYNTAMFGLFILSMIYMAKQQHLKAAFVFSSLLCFKHIYLYVAHAFFVGLLWQYILGGMRPKALSVGSLINRGIKLGGVTLAPFAAAFGPFVWQEVYGAKSGLLFQILSRLFPFSRGLTHAYWAPNFWALYTFADRVLGVYYKNANESATRGIVGAVDFSNLPAIGPKHTFYITLAIQTISVLRAGYVRSPAKFTESVTLCGFAAFLFGWHVHEKAIMTVIVPFALLATESKKHTRAFLPLLASGCFSLFPLIWTPAETVVKSSYTWTYIVAVFMCIAPLEPGAGIPNWLYLAGFMIVMPAQALIPHFLPKYEYTGLMLVSVYSSLGVFWSWLQLLYIHFLH